MIVYFADRQMSVKGHASTNLPKGYVIKEDLKTEDVESGVSSFSCRVGFNIETRAALEEMTNAGNYLLRSNEGENEFYTIIETEIDTKNQEIYIYAEDAGLDLLNEIADSFEATETHTADWYINKYIVDSGFVIGINEIPENVTRTLKWDGEETVTARLASIATQFGGYEISFSFEIKGLEITNKYINIHEKRGKDIGVTLWLNRDIDKIVTTKSIANLATAFECEGGIKDDEENPITFTSEEFAYDDGDFFVDGNKLKSRKANQKWSRYVWSKEPNQQAEFGGYIVRPYSYDTTDAQTLCSHAKAELKKVCDMEVNYEIDINKLPEGVKIGDRINIVDEVGELYVSSRVLQIEASVVDQKHNAILGEHLIKSNGISAKVAALAEQFAVEARTTAKALKLANTAKENAEGAKEQAEQAAKDAEAAQQAANKANEAAKDAEEAATSAAGAANVAEEAVSKVEQSVSNIEQTVQNAQKAVENAEEAARVATEKAEEAETAATNAQDDAKTAKESSQTAQSAAESAKVNAASAKVAADSAKKNASEAIETARAAKQDAEQAEREIAALGENLETITDTLEADYARKTELTDTTAHLQSQISRNAAQLKSKVSLIQTIDETANDAREKANAAQIAAEEAQSSATKADTDARDADFAAQEAEEAAIRARNEAVVAREAADTARSVADQAEADLEAAIADLATIQARADATEEEIAAAQKAVNDAQSAADSAKADADDAAAQAADAQNDASKAVKTAWEAQVKAESARKDASNAAEFAAQLITEWQTANSEAEAAEEAAAQAKATANEAKTAAATAQALADATAETAKTAQATADEAAERAQNAQITAQQARTEADNAQIALAEANERFQEVMSNAEATAEEIAEATSNLGIAQAAATNAETAATEAETAATQAQADAEAALDAAEDAKDQAEAARADAEDAQAWADEAQAAVDGLAVRMTKAETEIEQNARDITLQVAEILEETTANGKNVSEALSRIKMLADSISTLVKDENGESLMTQTSEGWSFDISPIRKAIDSTSAELADLREYVKIGSYEYADEQGANQSEPAIFLGEGDTGFKLTITNTRIVFTDGSINLVAINSKKKSLEIEKAEIKGELQIGDDENDQVSGVWVWQQRSNGNLGLVWKGVTN